MPIGMPMPIPGGGGPIIMGLGFSASTSISRMTSLISLGQAAVVGWTSVNLSTMATSASRGRSERYCFRSASACEEDGATMEGGGDGPLGGGGGGGWR